MWADGRRRFRAHVWARSFHRVSSGPVARRFPWRADCAGKMDVAQLIQLRATCRSRRLGFCVRCAGRRSLAGAICSNEACERFRVAGHNPMLPLAAVCETSRALPPRCLQLLFGGSRLGHSPLRCSSRVRLGGRPLGLCAWAVGCGRTEGRCGCRPDAWGSPRSIAVSLCELDSSFFVPFMTSCVVAAPPCSEFPLPLGGRQPRHWLHVFIVGFVHVCVCAKCGCSLVHTEAVGEF